MRAVLAALCFCALSASALAQQTAPLAEGDRARIVLAKQIASSVGDRVWPNWSSAPFIVDLVTQQTEYLIGERHPVTGFTLLTRDEVLGSDIYTRPRVFPPSFEATFPLVDAVPVIVLGTMDNVQANTPTRWVVTLLHEHFHQWQYSDPTYFSRVEALGLTRGDKTGMWMLNYPFPYEKPEIVAAYTPLSNALADAVLARGTKQFTHKLQQYLAKRASFRAMLSADDYKYFAFQCWAEGVARYTEVRIAQAAARAAFSADANANYHRIIASLRRAPLTTSKREVVYAFGAGEALLLDASRPGWKARYLAQPLDLGAYF